MRYSTPLRYPGGKGKLSNYVKLIFQQNNLLDVHYAEPYAGGAGVALSLLFEEYASHIHINDLSLPIYAFWHSVLNETNSLCRLVQHTEVSIDEWRKQKLIQERARATSLLELGFSTFFLNRTNRSGIITGGVIGGKNQTGEWKLDARYNKENLIERIKKVARYRQRINIYNLDAAEFIQHVLPTLPTRALAYLDPPYYVKGQGLYENFYQHEDHENISNLVSGITHNWMISYDNAPEIMPFYKQYRSLVYHLNYSAADRYKGSEVMFFCDNLAIPKIKSPAKVSSRLVYKLSLEVPLLQMI